MLNFKNKVLGALLVMIISLGFVGQANAVVDVLYDYAKGIGSTGADVGVSIISDSSGNSYTTGYFNGTVDFDPGVGTSNLTSAGGSDIFIEKLDSTGAFVWVKQIGGTGADSGNDINIYADGNIYVVGNFTSTVDFDPGAGTSNLTSAGSTDVFILKLDSSGNFVSVKQVGGTGADSPNSVVFYSGSIFVTGNFVGTVDFDPGAGTTNLTSGHNFILKLDSSGNFVWAKGYNSSGWADWAGETAIDSSGNIYTTGSLGNGTGDFDPGAGVANLTPVAGGDFPVDAYLQKLDVNGDFVWVKQFGGGNWDSIDDRPVIDSSGNVYVEVTFSGTVDFDPGVGTTNLTSAGSNDFVIEKLDSSGNLVWVKQFGSTGSDAGSTINIDSGNNLYIGEAFEGTVDFDPGVGTSNLTSSGGREGAIHKLDSDGNFIYVKQFGGSGDDRPKSITIDSIGRIYTTGWFNNTADFDPSSSTANLTSAGGNDIFISRLIPDIVAPTFVTSNSSGLTNTTATITWTTNEASSSIVEYGLTTSYGSTTTEADTGAGTTSHSVNLTGLDGCTTYHYRVKSNDPSANLGTSSDNTFSTSGCAAVPIYILQAMSDAIRAQQNNNTVTPVTTNNTQTNTNTNSNLTPTKFIFTRNLKLGMRDTQVIELQKFLNRNSYFISQSGTGSPGNETNYFGLGTRAALIKFQKAFDIKPAVGYFGPTTRGVVNNK